jgi:ABC-type phosphate transport system permease subunit
MFFLGHSRLTSLESRVLVDFIERIFHISPDHGSGVLEATILLTLLLIPIAVALLRSRLRRQNAHAS